MSRGKRYADALAGMFECSWFDLFEKLSSGGFDGPEGLVLIHPHWYGRELGASSEACPFRGKRSFSLSAPRGVTCQSRELWGYDCPFRVENLAADHRFPFSLGGPTRSTNLIWLCEVHNSAKAADWHLDEPRAGDLPWFSDVLGMVRRHLLNELQV